MLNSKDYPVTAEALIDHVINSCLSRDETFILIALIMLGRDRSWRPKFLTIETVATKAKYSRRTLSRVLKRLTDKNLLHRENAKGCWTLQRWWIDVNAIMNLE